MIVKTKDKLQAGGRLDFQNEIRKSNFKTYFLFLIFFALIFLIAIAIKVIFSLAGYGILFIAGVIAIIYALIGYFAGDKIVLFTSGAKEADPKKYMHLHNVVEGLAIASGIPKPKVYVIMDQSPNAFATGRDPKHASIAVTAGILEIMNRQELEGVIAHELSHILNRDVKVMTIVSVLFGIISIVSDIALRGLLWGGASGDNDNKGSMIGIIIAIVLVIIAPLIAMLIQLGISRSREYLADSSAARITRYPKGLADALLKISKYSQPLKNATKGTAHLYIVNPLKAGSLANLFSTHPPIEERIRRLNAM